MNHDIVNTKIGNSVCCHACTDQDTDLTFIDYAQHDAQPTWNCKDQRKPIILFESPIAFNVMTFMQEP